MAKTKRVLLSGGTGMIGTALSRSLGAQGVGCLKLVRGAGEAVAGASVLWEPGRSEAPVEDVGAVEGCDAVVHLAGANLAAHRWTPAYKKVILESRVNASRAIVSLIGSMKVRPRVLVCASATGIYGDRGDELLTEDSPPGVGFLPEVCEAWERSAEGAAALGCRVVHLRFGVVLARHGGAMEKLLPLFRSALGGRLGDGRQWTSWVTLEDVVRAIEYSLERDEMSGVYNTVTPNPVTNRMFTAELARAVHRPAPWIVPAFALKAMFGQMAEDTLLASSRVAPARLEAAGFRFAAPELGPALAGLLRA